MKVDKEFLVKNQFWVLLGVAVPLTLVAIVILLVVVPGQTAAAKKKVEDQYKAFKDYKTGATLKNDRWVAQAQKRLKDVQDQEGRVWGAAWVAQEEMFSWPDVLDDGFRNGLFVKAVTVYPPDTKWDQLMPPEAELKAGKYTGVFHGALVDPGDGESIRVQRPADKKNKGATRRFLRPSDSRPVVAVSGKEADKLGWSALQGFKDHKLVVLYEKGKTFGDELTSDERDKFARRPDNDPQKLPNFQSQVLPVLETVGPVNEFGEPVVQFKNWTFGKANNELFYSENYVPSGTVGPTPVAPPPPFGKEGAGAAATRGPYEFFPHVPKKWENKDRDGKVYDSTRDAWTFQENLWVTRELYRQLRTVNQQVAAFQARGSSGGKDAVYNFENPYWRLEIQPDGEARLKVTIRNLLDTRQKIPAVINVKVQKAPPAKAPFVQLKLKAPPLAARGVVDEGGVHKDTHTQVVDVSEQLRGGAGVEGVFAVEQVLTWETAGVKRIDALHIGTREAQSHRTFIKALKPFFVDKEKKDERKEEGDGDKKGGREKYDRFSKAEDPVTVNGMVMDRYLDVTKQSRQLPVCLVVVVDQEQVYRVQAALADCKFRFLTTQVIMNRCGESMRPYKQEGTGPGEGRPGPMSQPQEELGLGGSQPETNVELVVYGVITLYERYPPRQGSPGEVKE